MAQKKIGILLFAMLLLGACDPYWYDYEVTSETVVVGGSHDPIFYYSNIWLSIHVDTIGWSDYDLEVITPNNHAIWAGSGTLDGCTHYGDTVECAYPVTGYYEIRVLNYLESALDSHITISLFQDDGFDVIETITKEEVIVGAAGIGIIPMWLD